MRKGVVDVGIYENSPNELLLGQIAILGGASAWLLLATFLNAPVSTTHAVVGATLGFSLLLHGANGIEWMKIVEIGVRRFEAISSQLFLRFSNFSLLMGYRAAAFGHRKSCTLRSRRSSRSTTSKQNKVFVILKARRLILQSNKYADCFFVFQRDPCASGLRWLPAIFFVCIAFNTFAVVYDGSKCTKLRNF